MQYDPTREEFEIIIHRLKQAGINFLAIDFDVSVPIAGHAIVPTVCSKILTLLLVASPNQIFTCS